MAAATPVAAAASRAEAEAQPESEPKQGQGSGTPELQPSSEPELDPEPLPELAATDWCVVHLEVASAADHAQGRAHRGRASGERAEPRRAFDFFA